MNFWEFIHRQSDEIKMGLLFFVVMPLVGIFIWTIVQVVKHVL